MKENEGEIGFDFIGFGLWECLLKYGVAHVHKEEKIPFSVRILTYVELSISA